jgi:predicted sulfurtransferase
VRNGYESLIGGFKPPEGGAELLDPKMRNSHEFPKWLNLPETQDKLRGKNVMMYCTGGIRCERASALLSQMEAVTPSFSTGGITMVRGGVDRYIKTYPGGGHWSGKNYLFDMREEQVPDGKSDCQASKEAEEGAGGARCCLCSQPWSKYKDKHMCVQEECKTPVLVCDACRASKAPEVSLS